MHQFSGSTIEEALQLATAELGRDLTVVRARRVTSKRTLGFGSKVRFEVDVLAGSQTPMIDTSSTDGEFGGVLAGLIDNIERLEADQHRGSFGQSGERERNSGSELRDPGRSVFGDADLAPGPGGYGTNAGPSAGRGGRASPAGTLPSLDLRSMRSEVDDDVLASLADRPVRRSAPADLTPSAARLTRAVVAPEDLAEPASGAGTTSRGTARAVRPTRVPTPAIPVAGASADALARAARKAAERAAAGRSASLLDDAGDAYEFADRGADLLQQQAERRERERQQREDQRRRDEDQAQLLAERALVEQLAAERAEAARLEADRLATERVEQARREVERAEVEQLLAERREAERRQAERLAAEREEAARLEAERLAAEREEAARLEAERRRAERREAVRLEAERALAERAEADRLEARRLEAERVLAEEREAAELQAMRLAAERARLKELDRQAALRRESDVQARFERERAERAEAEATEMRRRLEAEREVAAAWLADRECKLGARSTESDTARAPLANWSRRAVPAFEEDIVDAEWVSADDAVDAGTAVIDLVGDRAAGLVSAREDERFVDAESVADDEAPLPKRSERAGQVQPDVDLRSVPEARAEPTVESPRLRRTRRRLRDLSRRDHASGAQAHRAGATAGTAIELVAPGPDATATKSSAGLMSSLSSSRGLARQPVRSAELTNRMLSFGLDESGSTELALGGEPQWSLENLAAMGLPPVAIESLGRLDLRVDADWMSAVELFIRENVPAPVSRAEGASGVFLSGSDAHSASAIIRAGLLGFVPGYIFVDGQFRLASSIELMLAIRSCLPR